MGITARSKINESELAFPESTEAKEHRETREALVVATSQLERSTRILEERKVELEGAARERIKTALIAFTSGCYIASGLLAHDLVWLWEHAPWS